MNLKPDEYETGVVDAKDVMSLEHTPVIRKKVTPFRLGNHLYAQCGGCNRYVRLTGFLGGFHLCQKERTVNEPKSICKKLIQH